MADKKQKKGNGLVAGCCALMNKFMPDAFIFAVVLTIVILIAAVIYMFVQGNVLNQGFITRIINLIYKGWYGGFWSLLAFSMQMSMVVVTGSILANTPAVKKGLKALAKLPKSPQMAVWLVAFVALVTGWLNWGASLVMAAILAKEVAKEVKGVHYALLVAGGYIGLGIWHAGFSGSIPLQIASAGAKVGAGSANEWVSPGIAFNQTIFSAYCLVPNAVCMIVMPIIMMKMHPTPDKVVTVDPKVFEGDDIKEEKYDKKNATPAVKMEHSKVLNYIIVAMGALSIFMYFFNMAKSHTAFSMSLDFVNFLFLIAAMALFKTPIETVKSVNAVAAGAAGVMLQFPFYGGLSAMMTYCEGANKSLAKLLSDVFVSISTPFTFPLWIFLSAGIINFFVPSGGGQWQVQGPIIMNAVQDPKFKESVGEGKAAMCIAWGDCWTNLIQPFWALPLLAVAKLQARDIMGYCVLLLFVEFVIVALSLLFL